MRCTISSPYSRNQNKMKRNETKNQNERLNSQERKTSEQAINER